MIAMPSLNLLDTLSPVSINQHSNYVTEDETSSKQEGKAALITPNIVVFTVNYDSDQAFKNGCYDVCNGSDIVTV